MRIEEVGEVDGELVLRWSEGTESSFSAIWLRDNDPSAFDPETQERVFDLLSIGIDILPSNIDLADDGATVCITWPDRNETSRFEADWLWRHRPGNRQDGSSRFQHLPWGVEMQDDLLTVRADDIKLDGKARLEFLNGLTSRGIAIVSGLGQDENAGIDFAQSIGPLRNSNFGIRFDVKSKPSPNNLAYTSHHLPLHTDLPNQEIPPGFQFLHCILNEAEGGNSTFCDGLKIAADLEKTDAEAFQILRDTPIPYRFQDATADLMSHRPVFVAGQDGQIDMVVFNPHIAAPFDMPAEVVAKYYPAYRTMMAMTRNSDYIIETRLKSGDMVIFDNRRVLHGRTRFDPQTGQRFLRGCYVDHHDIASQMRILSKQI
jgi:gamma-butyrobetaine dioxygenase